MRINISLSTALLLFTSLAALAEPSMANNRSPATDSDFTYPAYRESTKTMSAGGLSWRIAAQGGIVIGSCSFDAVLVAVEAILDSVPLVSGTLGHAIPWAVSVEDKNHNTYDPSANGLDGDEYYKGGNGTLGVLAGVADLVAMLFDILPDSTLEGGKYHRPFQMVRKNYRTTGFTATQLFNENALCTTAFNKVVALGAEIGFRAKRDLNLTPNPNASQNFSYHLKSKKK